MSGIRCSCPFCGAANPGCRRLSSRRLDTLESVSAGKIACPTAIFEEGGTDHRLSWSVMPCPTTVGDRRQKAIVCPTSLLHGKLEIHLQHQRVVGHAEVRYRELAGFAFVPGLRRSLFKHLPRLRLQCVLEVSRQAGLHAFAHAADVV